MRHNFCSYRQTEVKNTENISHQYRTQNLRLVFSFQNSKSSNNQYFNSNELYDIRCLKTSVRACWPSCSYYTI